MKLGYADPPYPGGAHLYKDHPDFAGEVDRELQRAYDFMWVGEPDKCDEVTAHLPEKEVQAMLNAWLDDQDDGAKSKWY